MARLFFAIWPGEAASGALARLSAGVAERLGGRPVPPEKIHLTLAFLGEVGDDRIADVHAAADAVRGMPFVLALDRLGSFRRAGVAWAGAASPDPALATLQSALVAALRDRGIALEARPFSPHVTLARRIVRALGGEAIEPVGWHVEDFALVCSEPGSGRYRTVARWPLRGPEVGPGPVRG